MRLGWKREVTGIVTRQSICLSLAPCFSLCFQAAKMQAAFLCQTLSPHLSYKVDNRLYNEFSKNGELNNPLVLSFVVVEYCVQGKGGK